MQSMVLSFTESARSIGSGIYDAGLKLLHVRRKKSYVVPTQPRFKSIQSTQWFSDKLRQTKIYLEYGAGGSTYLAAKYCIPFLSVDSDESFLESVRDKIVRDGLSDTRGQTFIHADIGPTKKWGIPDIVFPPCPYRRKLFARYSDLPAAILDNGLTPDLTLIDGRFRVACALKFMRAMRNKDSWVVAFDDYNQRDHYRVMEEINPPQRIIGQMGIFLPAPNIDLEKLDRLIADYELDYR